MSLRPQRSSSVQRCLSSCPSAKRQCVYQPFQDVSQQRSFHISPSHQRRTRLRQEMIDWFAGPGKQYRHPLPGSTNYLSAYDRSGNLLRLQERGRSDEQESQEKAQRDPTTAAPPERASDLRPFPLNNFFRSESVLSEETREELYQLAVVNKADVSTISAAYGIDLRRVAAVVRMKTIEKQWQEQGKQLAKPYNDAVLAMLPKTPYRDNKGNVVRHESINDLPVHPSTRHQLFYPASESRVFTRKDAAQAFSATLLPADERIAHPELIMAEKWRHEGVSPEERKIKLRELDQAREHAKQEHMIKHKAWEERTQRVVPGRRWDFKFQDISVESVGPDGRGPRGVGLRYGYAHNDRKRGTVKIPTSVE